MKVENKTTLSLQLDDLLSKQSWEVEYGSLNLPIKLMQPLEDWKVEVRWLNGKHPFHGRCQPSQRLITIAINKNITYPFTQKFAVGTKQIFHPFHGYEYVMETVTFNSPNELIRFIFLHEFSHLLDYLRGLNMHRKQTRANRFALKHFKR
ncbi:hypothetical protein G4O51_11060 [Candidatus Bathyarchaeota archaeon A05DMB-2]|jgi:hypothetical protein|nr:hypothetical protein [Candidatus Bathyarchaeota archaeon A05DMB-2]